MNRLLAILLLCASCATLPKAPQTGIQPTVPIPETPDPLKCTERPCVLVGDMLGTITPKSTADTMHFLDAARKEKADAVAVFIYSYGGSANDGRKIMALFQSSSIPVHCYAQIAASSAFFLFQVCADRTVAPDAHLMMHEEYMHLKEDDYHQKELQSIADDLETDNQELCAILAPRMHMTQEALYNKISQGDWVIEPRDALAAGIIDSIDFDDDTDGYVNAIKAALKAKK